MKKKKGLIPSGGNDKVYTPDVLADKIVSFFHPYGQSVLEPCRGGGAFINALAKNGVNAEWCEIDDGVDFFDYSGRVDWIITNPPYSIFRDFLIKSMEVANNVVFLASINAFFFKARLRDIREHKFGFHTIIPVDTPKEWPSSGIQLGVVYIRKNYFGKVNLVYSGL